jgi:hypothetical protein
MPNLVENDLDRQVLYSADFAMGIDYRRDVHRGEELYNCQSFSYSRSNMTRCFLSSFNLSAAFSRLFDTLTSHILPTWRLC